MDYQEIKQLIDQLDQSSLAYFHYQDDQGSLELSKEASLTHSSVRPQEKGPTEDRSQGISQPSSPDKERPAEPVLSPSNDSIKDKGTPLTAPMVGIAYMQPSPDEPPYVQVGDRVEKGQVVLIIEAMKLMTEIEVEVSGIVKAIHVSNGDLVEYDQVLMEIDEQ